MTSHYVIYRRDYGPGLNSLVAGFLGHLFIAEKADYSPVIDLANYPSVYQEDHPINGTTNVWEYYFEPVSSLTLEAAYAGNPYVDSGGGYPHHVVHSLITKTPSIRGVLKRWVRLNESARDELEKASNQLELGRRTLGVHFRGGDMRRTKNHPMPPSQKQIFSRIDAALGTSLFDEIFLVTEHKAYLEQFVARYGRRIRFLDVARYGEHNIYKDYIRPNHRYRLGLEVLIETYCLSYAGGLISGYSGVSEMAETLSGGNYTFVDKVWNGRLPFSGELGEAFWSYRASAPRLLGGFGR